VVTAAVNGEIYVCFLFPHRTLAACDARSWRSSGVIVSRLRLPPSLPPFLPIARITREISALVGLGGFVGLGAGTVSGSAVERCTMRKAAWFSSIGLLLIRFGIAQVCHMGAGCQIQSSPLPKIRAHPMTEVHVLIGDSARRDVPSSCAFSMVAPNFVLWYNSCLLSRCKHDGRRR
jgi:hypothetical protein